MRETIYKLGLDGDQYLQTAKKMQTEIDRLTERQKLLSKTNQKSTDEYQTNSAALKDNKKELNLLTKQIEQNNAQQKKTADVTKEVTTLINKEGKTINELRNNNAKLLKIKNNLILTNDKEAKLAKKIDAQLNKNNETIKENSDAYSQQKLNIGNYGSALDALNPRLKGIITQGNQLVVGLYSQATAAKASAVGTSGLSKVLKVLKYALIATGVGALVVLLGSLVAWFTKTQKGVDFVSKAMAGLGAAFDVVIDRLSDIGEAFKKLISGGGILTFFSDVKEAAKGVGDEMAREVELAYELEAASQKVRDAEIALIVTQAKRKKQIENLRFEAKNELLSLDERAAKLQKAQNLEKEILADQIKIAKENSRISQEKLGIGKSLTAQTEETAKLQAAVIELETQSAKQQRTIEAEKQSLQKRSRSEATAAHKIALTQAKEITDQSIKDNETRLKLFIEENQGKVDSLEEQLKFIEDVKDRELLIQEEKFAAGQLNQIEYELAILEIKNNSLEAQAQLTTDQAIKEKEAEQIRLEEKQEEEKTRIELKKEADLLDFESEQILRVERDGLKFEAVQKQLNKEEAQAIAHAKKVGGDVTKVEEVFANRRKKLKQAENDFNLGLASDAFNNLATILGKESKAGKAAAIAAATISTFQSAVNSYNSLSGIPIVGPVLGGIAAAAAVASGIAQVKKIAAVEDPNIPKAERGMLINGMLQGKSHAEGGIPIEVEGGEAIINKRSMADPMLRSLASQINVAGGGVQFANGGLTGAPNISTSALIDYDLLAVKIANANLALPSPVVFVEDINSGQQGVAVLENGANV